MNLKMRLVISYTVLALISTFIMSYFFNYYVKERYYAGIYNHVNELSKQNIKNFEIAKHTMEQAAQFILSDQDTLTAIRYLSTALGDEQADLLDLKAARSAVRRNVNSAYNLEHFYRVIVFNQHGYIASSANAFVDESKDISEIPWLGQAVGTKGQFVFLGIHDDDWGAKEEPVQVYSIVKEIQGDQLGFIEIQIAAIQFKELFFTAEKTNTIVLRSDASVLYAAEGINVRDYQHYYLQKHEDGVLHTKNQITGKDEIVVIETSDINGVKTLLIQSWEEAAKNIPDSRGMPMMLAGIFMVFSLCFIIITAHLLTKPIRQLRKKMQLTNLANIYEPFELQSSDADIQALAGEYKDLLKRLQEAAVMEKKLSMVQMQTQLDMLQAQINPHFIFNVLSVISNRGIKENDEVICEICGNLASMLRYSTNNKERYATIQQEMQYLKNYVYLLKARYETRLDIKIAVEEEMMLVQIPKICIQQLVENSIEHGYRKLSHKMEIEVCGYRVQDGWRIIVQDNGQGIPMETLNKLREYIKETRLKIKEQKELLELEIGGMGLVNTFARLYLLNQEEVCFSINNRADGQGTTIIIGAKERK